MAEATYSLKTPTLLKRMNNNKKWTQLVASLPLSLSLVRYNKAKTTCSFVNKLCGQTQYMASICDCFARRRLCAWAQSSAPDIKEYWSKLDIIVCHGIGDLSFRIDWEGSSSMASRAKCKLSGEPTESWIEPKEPKEPKRAQKNRKSRIESSKHAELKEPDSRLKRDECSLSACTCANMCAKMRTRSGLRVWPQYIISQSHIWQKSHPHSIRSAWERESTRKREANTFNRSRKTYLHIINV